MIGSFVLAALLPFGAAKVAGVVETGGSPIPAKAAQSLLSEREIFDVKLKCQQLGEKMLEEDHSGSYWYVSVTTNYDFVNHHCYIKRDASTADYTKEPHKIHTSLHDGITGEMLADTQTEGMGYSAKSSGKIFDPGYTGVRDYTGKDFGFDVTEKYINRLMTTKRDVQEDTRDRR
jgi:hypothetical protein